MQHLLDRYSTLTEGRFHRKQKLDEDRSPQELARVIVRAVSSCCASAISSSATSEGRRSSTCFSRPAGYLLSLS